MQVGKTRFNVHHDEASQRGQPREHSDRTAEFEELIYTSRSYGVFGLQKLAGLLRLLAATEDEALLRPCCKFRNRGCLEGSNRSQHHFSTMPTTSRSKAMPSTTPLLKQHVDVLEMNEAFEEVDGCFKFAGTLVVYRADGDVHHAVSKIRYSSLTQNSKQSISSMTF